MPDGAEPPPSRQTLADAGVEARIVGTVNEGAALAGAAAAAALPYDAVLVDRRPLAEPAAALGR